MKKRGDPGRPASPTDAPSTESAGAVAGSPPSRPPPDVGKGDPLFLSAQARLGERYGVAATSGALAPGRVNLIGEHTDYNLGFVLPLPIDRRTALAAAPGTRQGRLRLWSEALEDEVDLSLSDLSADRQAPPWSAHVRGVLAGLAERGMDLPALDAAVVSELPVGGGLSSSAALMVALCLLVERWNGTALDPRERAHLCREAEERFAGVPCGIMDPLASSLAGTAGASALLIDCRDESVRPIALGDALAVVITDCGVRHHLGDSGYRQRRAECDEAARRLGLGSLREVTEADGGLSLPEPLAARVRHVVSENARTLAAAEALSRGDLPALGRLLLESHRSLRDDFEVSTAELDALVDAATAIGPDGGVHGARLTGGGFGGSTLTLVDAERAADVCVQIAEHYQRHTGRQTQPFVARAAAAPVAFFLDEVES